MPLPFSEISASAFHKSRKANQLRAMRGVTNTYVEWRTQEDCDKFTNTKIDKRQQYTEGVLIQQVGDAEDSVDMCNYCSRGFGPFSSCVRVSGVSLACGNCIFQNRAILCCDASAPTTTRADHAGTPRKRKAAPASDSEDDIPLLATPTKKPKSTGTRVSVRQQKKAV